MTALETHDGETFDRKTSRSICDAVGQRLRQFLPPENIASAPDLERLVEELRRRDNEVGMSTPAQGRRFP